MVPPNAYRWSISIGGTGTLLPTQGVEKELIDSLYLFFRFACDEISFSTVRGHPF